MIVGDVPRRKGSAWGAGLSHEETIAHMSMWVMAASPLLTTVDVRNMTAETKAILTNPELLQIHKDPLGEHDRLRSSSLGGLRSSDTDLRSSANGDQDRCRAWLGQWHGERAAHCTHLQQRLARVPRGARRSR